MLQKECLQSTQLAVIDNCGFLLTDVLLYEIEILELLFPGGSMNLAMSVYEENHFSFICNQIASEAAIDIHYHILNLHCFEIGSGIGGVASFVLFVLSGGNAISMFTDLSGVFLMNTCL